MAILLADDDVQLATFLSKSLESEGYSVHTALDEAAVLAELKRQNYQLIILDLNLGNADGVKLLEELRAHGIGTPVMVLSARDRLMDRIQSLNSGADDYVTKPFSFQELAARVKAVLRRKADPALSTLRVENLELEPALRRVHRGEREIRLSPKEFELLHLMMRHAGEIVSRQELLRECWGAEPETDSNLVDVYVNYLRKKVDTADETRLIQTVRGTGYRLGPPASLHSPGETNATLATLTAMEDDPAAALGSGSGGSEQSSTSALIHSVAHDLAQPLTTLRCFLEIQAMPNSKSVATVADWGTIEQQADRAIALSKAISALAREVPSGEQRRVELNSLLNDSLSDLATVTNGELLKVKRDWQESFPVSSSPVLRHVFVFLLCKLVGRITQPFVLTLNARTAAGQRLIAFNWVAEEESSGPLPDADSIFGKDLPALKKLMGSLEGEIHVARDECELNLMLPSA